MNHRFLGKQRPQQGVTILCVILTITVLAILSHNIVNNVLEGYCHGARIRDMVVLHQLTDSALAQVLYHLNRGDSVAAAAPVRESFGIAQIEIGAGRQNLVVRISAYAPDAERPRSMDQLLFRLARNSEGRWSVASVTRETGPVGRPMRRFTPDGKPLRDIEQ